MNPNAPAYDRVILASCQATYLPEDLGFRAGADLDGTEARRFLESAGFDVAGNADKGTHGEAWTECGIILSTNGYCHRVAPDMPIGRAIVVAALSGLAGHLATLEDQQRKADASDNRSPSHILDNRIADIRAVLEDEGRTKDQDIADALLLPGTSSGARSVLEGEQTRRTDAKTHAEIRRHALAAAARYDRAAEDAENNHDEEQAYWWRVAAREARETADRYA